MSDTHTATPKKRIAILLENQFEDAMFQVPNTALRKAGAARHSSGGSHE